MVWTAGSIAKAASMSRRQVSRLIKQGEIEGELTPAGWIVMDEEAQRFIEERQAKEEPKEESAG